MIFWDIRERQMMLSVSRPEHLSTGSNIVVAMAMIFRSFELNTTEYTQALRLREDILRRPLGLTITAQELAHEADGTVSMAPNSSLYCCCNLWTNTPFR